MFRNLDLEERAQILTIGQPRSYRAEQVLFHEGEPGDGLFLLVSGSVRISKRSGTGEEALAILEPNAFFGEMSLVDFQPRAADAIAHSDIDVFFIPLPALRVLLETHHPLAMKVLFALCEVLTQRLRETNDRFMSVFTLAQWGSGLQNDLIPLP
ncbi:MAG: cyclic nucleotide-binding domain-containing protein [Holophaga sp.]|nr:cyclic nucleotide-binding domain-containing protein [Holophaga sp.]